MGLNDLRNSTSEKAATRRGACDSDAITETLEVLVKKLASERIAIVGVSEESPATAPTKPSPKPEKTATKLVSESAPPPGLSARELDAAAQEEDDSIFASPWFWIVTGSIVVSTVVGVALVEVVRGDDARVTSGGSESTNNQGSNTSGSPLLGVTSSGLSIAAW